MIRHTVVFTLKYAKESPGEKAFLTAASKLSAIPGVRKFEPLRQTSKKNDFTYGLSMEFDTGAEYDAYNQHPDHAAFIRDYWIPFVEKYMEIDYELIN